VRSGKGLRTKPFEWPLLRPDAANLIAYARVLSVLLLAPPFCRKSLAGIEIPCPPLPFSQRVRPVESVPCDVEVLGFKDRSTSFAFSLSSFLSFPNPKRVGLGLPRFSVPAPLITWSMSPLRTSLGTSYTPLSWHFSVP